MISDYFLVPTLASLYQDDVHGIFQKFLVLDRTQNFQNVHFLNPGTTYSTELLGSSRNRYFLKIPEAIMGIWERVLSDTHIL